MRPNSDKNRQLIRQYPFIAKILEIAFERSGSNDRSAPRVDDLNVRVEKADGDLMYRQANNIGLGDHSFLFTTEPKRKGQVGRRVECILAVNKNGDVLDILYWPRNDEERRGKKEIYASAIFWATRYLEGGWYSDPYWDMVDNLVWVTVEAWHDDARNDDLPEGRFGELRSRVLDLTIFTKPECGFRELETKSCFEKNLRLSSRRVLAGHLAGNVDIIRMSGMLDEMCLQFGEEVFFAGMKDVLDQGPSRGASGQFGSAKVLAAELCGYDRVMIEDAVSSVTFQRRPDSDGLYVLGMDGTLPQLRSLVRGVIRGWQNDPVARASFRPDGNVRVL